MSFRSEAEESALAFDLHQPHTEPEARRALKRTAHLLWALALLVLLGTYFRHLTADFPNGSPWSDWSKFTDEGWYSNAAIEHYLRGNWFQPGDFNAGVALPVWPLLLAPLFHFTGVSLGAARALAAVCFGGSLLAFYAFFRVYLRWWTAMLAVTLLASSSFLYAFSRLAILEPPVMLWLALLLLTVARARLRGRAGWLLAGLLIALMVFTKTTSAVLVPAPLYLLWRRADCRRWAFVRAAALAGGVAALLAFGYLSLVAATHNWPDFRYFFVANERPILTLHSRVDAFRGAVANGKFFGRPMYWGALAVLAAGAFTVGRLRRNALFGCCALWLGCGIFFVGWHASMQPRYYYTLAPAAAALLALGLETGIAQRHRLLVAITVIAMAVGLASGLHTIFRWQRHPDYTYLHAAEELTRTMHRQGGRNQLLMSISGSQLSLMTHVQTICDDYGTDEIEDRLTRYNPGWYATWDDIDPGTLESLHEQYSVHWIAGWPAMDEPERKVLNLFRLDPLAKGDDWEQGDDQLEP